jgi:hypothetical protein
MIKFRGERERYKIARTMVPRTAEFEAFRIAKVDERKSELMDEAFSVLGRAVDAHPDLRETGICPDNIYEDVMRKRGFREQWEEAFGGEQNGRDMFGLVAWTYFFKHQSDWLGTPPDTAGLGKQGWKYTLRCGGYRVGQCVQQMSTGEYGRIIGEPNFDCFYKVRFRPGPLGGPGRVEQVPDNDLVEGEIDDQLCAGIASDQ